MCRSSEQRSAITLLLCLFLAACGTEQQVAPLTPQSTQPRSEDEKTSIVSSTSQPPPTATTQSTSTSAKSSPEASSSAGSDATPRFNLLKDFTDTEEVKKLLTPQLNNYKISYVATFEGADRNGNQSAGKQKLIWEYSKDSDYEHGIDELSSYGENPDRPVISEFYRYRKNAYAIQDNSLTKTCEAITDPNQLSLHSPDWPNRLGEALTVTDLKLVTKNERVNSIVTDKYTIDHDFKSFSGNWSRFTSVEVWLSTEYGYIVKYAGEYINDPPLEYGNGDTVSKGTFVYEVSDLGSIIPPTIPPECGVLYAFEQVQLSSEECSTNILLGQGNVANNNGYLFSVDEISDGANTDKHLISLDDVLPGGPSGSPNRSRGLIATLSNFAFVFKEPPLEEVGSLYVVDITEPMTPTLVSQTALEKSPREYNWEPVGMSVYGSNLFLLLSSPNTGVDDHLFIFDVTNLARPELRSSVAITGFLHDLTVINNYAYLAADDEDLVIVDVNDPSKPTEIKRMNLGWYGSAYYIESEGNHLFLGYHTIAGTLSNLVAFDISQPQAPVEIGKYPTEYGVGGLNTLNGVVYAKVFSPNDEPSKCVALKLNAKQK